MLSEVRALGEATWKGWSEDDAMQWGAAVAYYAALSLAPLLVTLLAVVGLFFDEATIQGALVDFVGDWIGEEGAELAATVFAQQQQGVFAGVTSAVLALVGATAVFGQLQKALNRLWQVEATGGIRRLLRARLLGFLMVLAIGALFLAALALQAVLAALPDLGFLGRALNLAGSAALFTLLFAAVYRTLPDVDIRWRDVWVGAAVTAVLFTVGQLVVGLYLGRSTVGSAYGAAGSLVAVLVWLYYSALVFFFGAEFTQVWARRHGQRIQPSRGAQRVARRTVRASGAGEDGRGAKASGGDGGAEEERPRGEREDGAEEGTRRPDPEATRVRGRASYP